MAGAARWGARRAPALAAVALLGGCVTGGPAAIEGPALPPAELPRYDVGDAFRFGDGTIHHVIGVGPDVVEWGIGDTYTYAAPADFTRPRLRWRWVQDDRTTRGTAELVRESGSLWPLEAGKEADYAYRFVSHDDATGRSAEPYTIDYRCGVAGTEAVTVPDGTYATYRVVCDHYWRQTHWQTETWNYAPAVGHVVRHDVKQWGGTEWRNNDLTEAGPAPAHLAPPAAAALAEAVQTALETQPSGDTTTATADDLRIAVTPTATWKTDAGVFCRSYGQTLTRHGRTSTQQGLACRSGDGVWRTPAA